MYLDSISSLFNLCNFFNLPDKESRCLSAPFFEKLKYVSVTTKLILIMHTILRVSYLFQTVPNGFESMRRNSHVSGDSVFTSDWLLVTTKRSTCQFYHERIFKTAMMKIIPTCKQFARAESWEELPESPKYANEMYIINNYSTKKPARRVVYLLTTGYCN